MDNKPIEDLKTKQEEAITNDITYLQTLESTLSEWDFENDEQDFQNL